MLTAVQEAGGVAKLRLPHGNPCWVVTGWSDTRTVYSSKAFTRVGMADEAAPRLTAGLLLAGAIGGQDDAVHLKLRRAIQRELTPERLALLRTRADAIMIELLDAMIVSGGGDYVSMVAKPFAVRVLCELLGVPDADREQLVAWVSALLTGAAEGTDPEAIGIAAKDAGKYIVAMIRERRRTPGSDLVSAFATRADELDTRELATIVFALVMGGFETTAHMLSKLVLRLLQRPDLWHTLCERPELLPSATEELLRITAIAGGEAIPWQVREEVTLAGVTMVPGEYVLPAVGAANFDPTAFPNAEEILLDRNGKTHLTFGHATHFCIGSQIARMELEVGLGALLRTCPRTNLAIAPEEVTWRSMSAVWELAELPLKLTRAEEPAV
ncbi:cytochrome P450 [Nocardia seriolae]|uniref:cytochrome P450 n=1 Tax=Nocardia seriolae TaxID=37332 RepID=UPI001319E650|nr:cytochrome P450 [Nocardia seriolae]